MNMGTDGEMYCNCMAQLLPRIALVQSIFDKRASTGHQQIDAEIVFLQFRKMLELIAFSSLIANKGVYSKDHASFATEWRATQMLK